MKRIQLMPILLLGLIGTACPSGPTGPALVEPANMQLKVGNLPGAYDEYQKIAAANPDSEHAVKGAAYAHFLAGEFDQADSVLAAYEAKAGEKVGEVKLRRAMVALRKGDLDKVKEHGVASGLPAGKVLAAEVHLNDSEVDEAIGLLKQAADAGGEVGRTAQKYIAMLESGDQLQMGLAEAAALWSLGQRDVACEQAAAMLKELPEDAGDRAELLLVWAGRAATSGRPQVALGLLDVLDFPPEGQTWRVEATRAMAMVADGKGEEGLAAFEALATAGAPADGLADARATAAALTKDPELAKRLIGDAPESSTAARSLKEAGAADAAAEKAPGGGALKQFLAGGGG